VFGLRALAVKLVVHARETGEARKVFSGPSSGALRARDRGAGAEEAADAAMFL